MIRYSHYLAVAASGAMMLPVGKALAEDPPAAPATPAPSTSDELFALVTPRRPNPQRAYAALPADEDWRWLKNGSKDADIFDPIKYVPIGDDFSLSAGGSARVRYEYKLNPGFGATNAASPTKNDDYILSRAYIHADARYMNLARVFVEGDFVYIDGFRRNPPPTPFPSDDADLHQAFLDISPLNYKTDGFGLNLRFGRQEMNLDRQKLVGVLDWANTRRTWDGFSTQLQWEQFKAQMFWLRPVVVNAKWFDTPDEETNFAGVNISHPTFDKDNFASFFTYYLNRSRDTKATFVPLVAEFNPDGQKGNTDRVTIGGRAWGKFATSWDYDAEGGVQVGRLADNDILAGYVSGEVGYTFADVYSKPRISLGYDYASGDDRKGDGQSNTFDQLFPTGHMYLGYLDLVGRQNVDAGNITITTNPTPDLKLWTSWHYFCLASATDALYNASGQALRYSPSGTAGTNIGNELDLTGSYQLGRHTTFLAGYGVLFPGDFISNTGKSETVQMVYTSVEFKF